MFNLETIGFAELAWIVVAIILLGIVAVVVFMLVWFVALFEYDCHDRFWNCKAGRFHFLPNLTITSEEFFGHHTFGVELAWLTRWCAIQWTFVDPAEAEKEIVDIEFDLRAKSKKAQCPNCKSFNVHPVGRKNDPWMMGCNTCGSSWISRDRALMVSSNPKVS